MEFKELKKETLDAISEHSETMITNVSEEAKIIAFEVSKKVLKLIIDDKRERGYKPVVSQKEINEMMDAMIDECRKKIKPI